MYYNASTTKFGNRVYQPERAEEVALCYRPNFVRRRPVAENVMQPKKKADWIEALRSGKYMQGQNNLQNTVTNENCCIGVKCVIDGLEFKRGGFIFPKCEEDYDGGITSSNTWLTTSYAKDQGMIDGTGTFYYYANFFGNDYWIKESLGNLNDCGFTFDQIADIIECFF